MTIQLRPRGRTDVKLRSLPGLVGLKGDTGAPGPAGTPGGGPPFYVSRAQLSSDSPTGNVVEVVAENEGAVYSYDPATSSPAAITTANGRKYRNVERVLTPAMFGAYPSSSDIRQALLDMQAELLWRGGGRVEFPDCKDFTVFATAPAAGSTLLDLRGAGLKHLTIRGNGSRILTPSDFYPNPVALTTTAGSTTATVSSAAGIAVGYFLVGPGLSAGVTTVSAIAGTTLTLNTPAIRTLTAAPSAWRTSLVGVYAYGLLLSDCRKFHIDLHFEHTHAQHTATLDPYTGLHGVTLAEKCVDGYVRVRQVGGSQSVAVNRPRQWQEAERSREIEIHSETDYTFYGPFLEQNGDSCLVYAKSDHVGRTAGCYSVSDVDFHVDSRAGDVYDDFLITSNPDPLYTAAFASATTGIRAYYRWRANPANTVGKGTLVNLGFSHLDAVNLGNGILRNIRITIDVDGSGGANATHPTGSIFQTIGAAAPAAGTHYMENVVVDGTVYNLGQTTSFANIFSDRDWTAVTRDGVVFDRLKTYGPTGIAWNIDGRGLAVGSVKFRDCRSLGNLTQTNVTAGTVLFDNARWANYP
jgi:hypothetical protein